MAHATIHPTSDTEAGEVFDDSDAAPLLVARSTPSQRVCRNSLMLFVIALVAGAVLATVFSMQHRAGIRAVTKGDTIELGMSPFCLGAVELEGHHDVQLIPEGWKMSGPDADDAASKPGNVKIMEDGKRFSIHHGSRVYMAETCIPGEYNPRQYTNLKLLGKRFRFTANIKGVNCGCNVAMYFTPMYHNTDFENTAGSYYCDANYVGAFTWGKKEEGCQEIDLLEGNSYSIHSTLHAWIEKQEATPENGYMSVYKSMYDHDGLSGGNGGGMGAGNGPRSLKNEDFAPGSSTIDTNHDFELSASFFEKAGKFDRFVVELHQGRGRNLTVIDTSWDQDVLAKHGSFSLNDRTVQSRLHSNPEKYGYEGSPMEDLTNVLKAGVTPIFSFWSSKNMDWMDGLGDDGLGPCKHETMGCDDMDVEFGGMVVEDIA